MVVQANRKSDGIGGHIASYASVATFTKSASTIFSMVPTIRAART